MRKLFSHLALVASFACAGPALAHTDNGVRNPQSSHDHHQLHDLLSGKIFVSRLHGFDEIEGNARGAMRVIHYAGDGRVFSCGFTIDDDRNVARYHFHDHETWLTEPHPKRLSRLRILTPDRDPTSNQFTAPRIYEDETGRFYSLSYNKGLHYVVSDGHLQASVPAVVYDLCPDFPKPEALGLPLNTKQTSRSYPALLSQDPDAPIRNFFDAPPAPAPDTGASAAPATADSVTTKSSSLEAAKVRAFSLREPARTFVADNSGYFVTDKAGHFYTYSPLTNQIMQIEGEDTVVRYANVSYLEGSPSTYRVAWSDGEIDLWPTDEPLPFSETAIVSRIGAFYDWLHGRPIDADIPGFLKDRIQFQNEGVLFVRGNGPAQHFAKGDTIIVQLRNGPARAFRWSELAADLGWKGFP